MKEITRERILLEACGLYLSEGLEGFSMRKLARRLGVTAPALYRHYESREHVLLDVVSEAYRRFARNLYRALEGRTPAERLRRAGQGYLDFALENPRLYEVLFLSPELIGVEEFPPELAAQACAPGQFWADRLRECMDAGILKPGDPHHVGVTMWAHAHGLVTLYFRGMLRLEEAEFRALVGASVERIMAGLGTADYREIMETADGNGGAPRREQRKPA